MLLLFISTFFQLIKDKITYSCFLYLALTFIKVLVAFLATTLTLLINLIYAIPVYYILFVSFIIIIKILILRSLYPKKPKVFLKCFKLFLILNLSLLALILICNSSDLALRLYPLDNIFIRIFNNRLVIGFYYYTLLASIFLYIYNCVLYNVKLQDCSTSYNYYLSRLYRLYIVTSNKRITWGLIFNIILILVTSILLKFVLLYFVCFVSGVKPGIYIIFIINITFIYILLLVYNKVYKLREVKPIIAVLSSLFKALILAIFIFELNLYLFGGCFIIYFWYIFAGDVTIWDKTNILGFSSYAERAEAISNNNNLSDLEKSNLLLDEINNVHNEINNNTISKQLDNNIAMPLVELPSLISTFNTWFGLLESYTNHLFSSQGHTVVQTNIFSGYFPNSLGRNNFRLEPGYLEINRIHALSLLHTYSDIYKVKHQWSLKAYDILHNPEDYTINGRNSFVPFSHLEVINLEQYMFIKNIVVKLGDADFNSKINSGRVTVHHVLFNLVNYMNNIEEMASRMDSLYRESFNKLHDIRQVNAGAFGPLIAKNISDGHLPLLRSQAMDYPRYGQKGHNESDLD